MKNQKPTIIIIALKILLNELVVDARGRAGNYVFGVWRGLNWIRRWVTPSNPQSVGQMLVRNFFKNFTSAWSLLSSARIIAWNNAAKLYQITDVFGKKFLNTGKGLFLNWNSINALSGGLTQINDWFAPSKPPLGYVLFSALSIDSTTGVCTLTTDRAFGANSVGWLEASAGQSQGTAADKGKYRLVKVIPKATAAGAVVFTSEYAAIFGAPVAGTKVFVKLRTSNDNTQGSVTLSPGIKGVCTVS